jgi:Gas vesicle synthesis protein GvpL/GvpF
MPVTGQSEGSAGAHRGCYVYGVVPHDVEPVPGALGVVDPAGQVQVVRYGEIAALVSEINVTRPLGRPEDLRAHQELLDGAATTVPVLPFRFGAVMTNAGAVAEELLAPRREEFAAALEELHGRAEYVIKGRYVEQTVLSKILAESQHAARLRESLRRVADPDASRDQRIQLGELINQAVSAKRVADTRALGEVLAGHVVASLVREPTHELDAAHVAVLAELAHQKGLENAVSELARDWDGRITVRLLGPMAPYDFAITHPPIN